MTKKVIQTPQNFVQEILMKAILEKVVFGRLLKEAKLIVFVF